MKSLQCYISQRCIGYRFIANTSESWFREVVQYTDGTTGTQYRASISAPNGYQHMSEPQEYPPANLIPATRG